MPRMSLILLTLLYSVSLLQGCPAAAQSDFPYENSAEADLTVVGSSALLFGLGYWVNSESPNNRPFILEEVGALDRSSINSFDQWATYRYSPEAAKISDILMYSSAVAPVSLSLTSMGSKEPLTMTAMHLETLLLNGGVTYLMKNLFRRTRPFVYNDDPRIPNSLRLSHTARRSFPSGHTSTAFASMVFLATVYGKMYPDSEARNWVWAGCLTTAGLTGYLRYAAGYHYPSDILAGAALGAFTGWLVPQLHEIDQDGPHEQAAKGSMVMGLSVRF